MEKLLDMNKQQLLTFSRLQRNDCLHQVEQWESHFQRFLGTGRSKIISSCLAYLSCIGLSVCVCSQGAAAYPENEDQQQRLREAAEGLRVATNAAAQNAIKKKLINRLEVSRAKLAVAHRPKWISYHRQMIFLPEFSLRGDIVLSPAPILNVTISKVVLVLGYCVTVYKVQMRHQRLGKMRFWCLLSCFHHLNVRF